MPTQFNSYIDNIDTDFWQDLCKNRGHLRHYDKGEAFITDQRIFPVGGEDIKSIVISLQNETRPAAQSNPTRSPDRQLRH